MLTCSTVRGGNGKGYFSKFFKISKNRYFDSVRDPILDHAPKARQTKYFCKHPGTYANRKDPSPGSGDCAAGSRKECAKETLMDFCILLMCKRDLQKVIIILQTILQCMMAGRASSRFLEPVW